ncbi:ArsR/SmtB family transcription factor [Hyphobacterium sp.]|uniref:ArsR/SmtB family transcription factor n=1 Tax=Hyphobacterium sp. TaxID=2004662 RepID=UPI003B51999A
MTADPQLDAAFAALAHPVRRAILARLAAGEATVNEIADPFDMSLPAVSKHIRVLEEAGLVTRGRQAQFRPCRLNPEPLATVAHWTEQYRPIWTARFDTMAEALKSLEDNPHE